MKPEPIFLWHDEDEPTRDPEHHWAWKCLWVILALIACYWGGRIYEREAHHDDMVCDLPETHLDAVLVWRDRDGGIRCQRRANPFTVMG